MDNNIEFRELRPENVEEWNSLCSLRFCGSSAYESIKIRRRSCSLLGMRPQQLMGSFRVKPSSTKFSIIVHGRVVEAVPNTMSESVPNVREALRPTERVESSTRRCWSS